MPLDEYKLSEILPTGIDIHSIPGMIPLFVELQACHAAEYRYFHDWQELTPKQQSILIAHYISVLLVKNNTQDAELRRQKLEALRAKAKKSK